MLDDFTIYRDEKLLNVNSDKKFWFHPKNCDSAEEKYSEVMNSPWYQRTVLKMGLNPLEEFLMPCALYHNFTGVDVYQKHSLGPWMIALILPKQTCVKNHHLGDICYWFRMLARVERVFRQRRKTVVTMKD